MRRQQRHREDESGSHRMSDPASDLLCAATVLRAAAYEPTTSTD
jgi:hypothetical protein